MKELKQIIIDELMERLNQSPFIIVTEYAGMTVPQFNELRNRLYGVKAECHVAKNSYVKRAMKAAELPEITEGLIGQTAVVTGDEDVCAAAKIIKNFHAEFSKADFRIGVVDGEVLTRDQIKALADLPSRDVLLATLLGVLNEPARRLVSVLNEPGASLARVVKARHTGEESG